MKNSVIKKMVIALCLGIFTMAACSKDYGIDGDSNSNELLISEISIDDVVIQRSEYNDKNLVTKQTAYDGSKVLATRIYTYNSDNLPVRVVNDFDVDAITENYVYDSEGKPISGTLVTDGEVAWSITFEYEKNKIIQKSVSKGGDVNMNTYTFDERGNLLKVELLQNTITSVNEWSDYDDKKGVEGSRGDTFSMVFSSPNNPRKARHSFIDRVLEYDFVYTYNDEGYPTIMHRYDKGTKDLVDIVKYKYISANK